MSASSMEHVTQLLITKFEGVSDDIISRIATKIAKTAHSEEEQTEAVNNLSLQDLLTSYGDARATEASQTTKKRLLKEYGLDKPLTEELNTTAPQGEQPTTTHTRNTNADHAADPTTELLEAIKALQDEVRGMKQEKVATSRKQTIADLTRSLPTALQNAYQRLPLEGYTDEAFQELTEQITAEVSEVQRDFLSKQTSYPRPINANTNNQQAKLPKSQEGDFLHKMGLRDVKEAN